MTVRRLRRRRTRTHPARLPDDQGVRDKYYRYIPCYPNMESTDTVTVSPKYQVVIPARIREEFRIRAGDKMAVIVKHGILHYVPMRPFDQTKGMTPGLDTKGLRDKHDRF